MDLLILILSMMTPNMGSYESIVVDRINDGIAVIELDEAFLEVDLSSLPLPIREGMVLSFRHNNDEEKRRALVSDLRLKRLKDAENRFIDL